MSPTLLNEFTESQILCLFSLEVSRICLSPIFYPGVLCWLPRHCLQDSRKPDAQEMGQRAMEQARKKIGKNSGVRWKKTQVGQGNTPDWKTIGLAFS